MPKITQVFILLACLLAFSPVEKAMADIYVYRDSDGVIHFTNAPSHTGYRPIIVERSRETYKSNFSGGQFEPLIRSASDRHGVDVDLIRAVIKAESDFNAEARSSKGALGLMQLMPETARLHNVNNIYDPYENINGGAQHLKLLLGRYQGNVELTLAAYNAGSKAVEKYGGIPPFGETQEYVRRVLGYYQNYRKQGLSLVRDNSRP